MSRIIRIFCILAILMAAVPVMNGKAESTALPQNCKLTVKPDKETYLICMPSSVIWNGDLVVFAHGYVFYNPNDPIPYMPLEQIQLPAGDPNTKIWLPSILNLLGYGFAMISYRKEGLAVQEGIQDMRNLVSAVRTQAPGMLNKPVRNVYVVGASEGGLVTTLLMERYASEFKGGLALCGPVGDFQKQVNYWGDFRAVLDVLFPVLPPTAVTIPPDLMADWASPDSTYRQNLLAAMTQDPSRTAALLGVTKAPIDPNNPVVTTPETVKGLLDYNIFATNEGKIELGVQPYSNIGVRYQGSGNSAVDATINTLVTRYPSDAGTPAALAPYQTTGLLKTTLVNMHTTLDPIIPIWQQALYKSKVFSTGSFFKYSSITVNRYGHCNFKLSEMLYSFFLMIFKANLLPFSLTSIRSVMPDQATYDEILALNKENVDITQGGNPIYLPLISR